VKALVALALLAVAGLSACGAQSATAVGPSAPAPGPPPAPTDPPAAAQTPQPSPTVVPTDTPAPTFTPVPATPTPLPTATPTPRPPAYPAAGYERLKALRFYHLQFTVKADTYDYSVVGDEATPAYHVSMAVPYFEPIELYFVGGHYYSGQAGVFTDAGASPPIQAGVLEASEQFAQAWFDRPDSAVFVAVETVNGVRADHFRLGWRTGRQATLGTISWTTAEPASGDAWIDVASGAIVKAMFGMKVTSGGALANVSSEFDLTRINQPVTIAAPALQKAPAGG